MLGHADSGVLLAFKSLSASLSVDDSQFSNYPGFILVSNSTVSFKNATFSAGNTNGAGERFSQEADEAVAVKQKVYAVRLFLRAVRRD